jgi:hypothetical protein
LAFKTASVPEEEEEEEEEEENDMPGGRGSVHKYELPLANNTLCY